MDNKIKWFWKVLITVVLVSLTIMMSAQAVKAQTYYFDEPNTLLNIDQCEGPIRVRLSSYIKLHDDEISIVGCEKLSNYVFTCDCTNSKKLEFQVSSNYSNAYNFDILYYIDYWYIKPRVFDENTTWEERNPTEEEIALDNNHRQVLIKGIVLREPKTLFNIKLNMTLGSIVLACVIIVIAGVMLGIRHFKKKLDVDNNIDQSQDMFNYSTLDEDPELNKIIDSAQDEKE